MAGDGGVIVSGSGRAIWAWRISGLLLWILVGAVVFQMSNRKRTEVPQAEQKAPEKPAIELEMQWPSTGLADFQFTECHGQKVGKSDLLGSPWVASFVFTRCAGPCPQVTLAMKRLHDRYRDQPVRFVTFTVDPKNDTPEVLRKYAEFWEADPQRWLFLTGPVEEMYPLINGSFLMPAMPSPRPKAGYEVIHTNNLCLVNAEGVVIGKFNSVDDADMVRLRARLDELTGTAQPAQSSERPPEAGTPGGG